MNRLALRLATGYSVGTFERLKSYVGHRWQLFDETRYAIVKIESDSLIKYDTHQPKNNDIKAFEPRKVAGQRKQKLGYVSSAERTSSRILL